MRRPSRRMVALSTILLVIVLSSCAKQPIVDPAIGAPGFLLGVWHGIILLPDLAMGFFDPEVRIYATPNSGWWYDLGFFFGVGSWGGTAFAGAKR